MFNLFTKVQSKSPKRICQQEQKRIYSNKIYSDFRRDICELDHKDLNIFTQVHKLKHNQLDLFTDVCATRTSLDLFTNIEETKPVEDLNIFSRIFAVKQSNLNLFTKIRCADFIFKVYDEENNTLIQNISWKLYKRDYSLGLNIPVDESHVLVDSGLSTSGQITIFLENYNLLNHNNDFYLNIWKQEDIYHNLKVNFSYYYKDYISNVKKCSYINSKLYLKKEGSGEAKETIIYKGIGGAGATPNEVYVTSRLIFQDEEDILCDLKEKIEIKTKLKSFKQEDIQIQFEGVSNVKE